MKRFFLLFAGCFVAAGVLWILRVGPAASQSQSGVAIAVKALSPKREGADGAAVADPAKQVEFVYELRNTGRKPLQGLRASLF
jgi:hypothetical protein